MVSYSTFNFFIFHTLYLFSISLYFQIKCWFDSNDRKKYWWISMINKCRCKRNIRCLNTSQTFPPGRPIWCNNNSGRGPTTRPSSKRGGHICCDKEDFCNYLRKPDIINYATALKSRVEGGLFSTFVQNFIKLLELETNLKQNWKLEFRV